MGRPSALFLSVAAAWGASAAPLADEREIVENFALLDETAVHHELYRSGHRELVLLVSFSGNDAAALRRLPHLEELAAEHEESLELFYVCGDPRQRRGRLRFLARKHELTHPILHDAEQVVLPTLGVERSGEAILADTRDWSVVYRGRVAELGPGGAPTATPLADAVRAFLEGRRPAATRTEPAGKPIPDRFPGRDVPDYATEIVPVLSRRCVPCHREDGIAPWAMSSHARVRGWSPMIREVVLTRRMPPWSADPEVGEFANDHSLATPETHALLDWIDADCPRGEGPDRLPELAGRDPEADEWEYGEPDLVYELEPYEAPAEGIQPYRFQRVKIEAEEDMWVRGVSVLPSNQRILHHCLILLEYPPRLKHLEPDYFGGAGSTFGFYVPGGEPRPFPEGTGKLLPAGATMIAQMHYVTTGRPEVDTSRIGIYLHDEEPPHELVTTSATSWEFEIPPHDPNHVVVPVKEMETPVILYDMTPHMHYRGKEMRYVALLPDGERRPLLSVVDYDFNWQLSYFLEEPMFLPAGTLVRCRSVFDNSATNPRNPDPSQVVQFGLQSADEMLIGYMNLRRATPEEAARYEETGDWR